MPTADAQELTDALERERRGLLAHCYRLLGSYDEAEDLVQETSLRAWRAWYAFEGRASIRVWLYRIATNACLTALEGRTRRALPSGLGAPTDDPSAPPEPLGPERWVEPFPTGADPAAVVADKENVRLAFVAGLQFLPAAQRGVLLLREVLAFTAPEVAEMLDTTVPAVKSLLQRARARIAEVTVDDVVEPTDPRARQLLDGYMAAWQTADLALFEKVLRADAALELVGSRTWFAGNRACVGVGALFMGAAGDWRMEPTTANGQLAVRSWFRGEPWGVAVLDIAADGITRVAVFGDPALVDRF